MKVVEKLFNAYNQVPSHQYREKYLAAVSILELTDGENGERMNKVKKMRDRLSENFPISIYQAIHFLESPVSRYAIMRADRTRFELNKARGDDIRVKEALAHFVERVNAQLVKSLEAYNTDRGRAAASREDDPLLELLKDEGAQ